MQELHRNMPEKQSSPRQSFQPGPSQPKLGRSPFPPPDAPQVEASAVLMIVRLEDLQPDAQVRGLMGRDAVRIDSAVRIGDLEIVSGGRRWSFDGDGDQSRLPGAHPCTESQH
jgi:hypothetical protein